MAASMFLLSRPSLTTLPNHESLTAPQRFTFTPVDVAGQGETHPTVIPIAPKNGMRMFIS